MNIKFYGFPALFATICCAQNAVAFDTPHGWKMMQTRDAITYEPADADSHETSVIIAPPFPAKGMNAVATLKDMAESADAFSLEDSDGIHKKGDRAAMTIKRQTVEGPARITFTAWPVGKAQMRVIVFLIKDDAALRQRYQQTADKIIEAQYAEDHPAAASAKKQAAF